MQSHPQHLHIDRIGSIAVKNVTSKSGLTQPVHFVCKNAAVDVVVLSAGGVDLTRATLELSLVYDARAPPYKLVDFVAGKKVLSYTAAGVLPHRATLQVRVGVLSSQVEGALFRVQIDAVLDGAVRHSVVSAPLTVVSKPYLALRAEGQRGKPKPENKRRYDQVSKSLLVGDDDASGDAADEPSRTRTVVGGGEVLSSLDQMRQEQLKQRRLLEQLLRNQQTQLSNAALQPGRGGGAGEQTNDTDDDNDAAVSADSDDEDDAEPVSQRVKRSRRAAVLNRRSAAQHSTTDDDDDGDDNDNNIDEDDEFTVSSSISSSQPPQQEQAQQPQQPPQLDTAVGVLAVPQPPPLLLPFSTSSFQTSLSLDKQLEEAGDKLTCVLSNYLMLHSEDEAAAVLRRVLPASLITALAPASRPAAVCDMFLNGCTHERELAELRKRDMLFGSAGAMLDF